MINGGKIIQNGSKCSESNVSILQEFHAEEHPAAVERGIYGLV